MSLKLRRYGKNNLIQIAESNGIKVKSNATIAEIIELLEEGATIPVYDAPESKAR